MRQILRVIVALLAVAALAGGGTVAFADHVALVRAIEREGPDVLREHMAQALRALRPGA